MLRPERMSKVSVTGSKRVMDEAIETVHGLRLLHVVDYDDSWEGFRPGDPGEEAEAISETLVTVRSIESILDVDEEDAESSPIVTDEGIDGEIEEVRARVNELDDRRAELREERREIDERLSSVRPFAQLGIDLDLLSGYDSLETRVVEGREERIRETLSGAEGIEEFETFAEGDVVAVFVYPEAGREDVLEDALVGVDASPLSVPDAETSPEEYVDELEERKAAIDDELEGVDDELEEVKLDAAGFLLAVEEQLSIDVQKAEVPLSFATTDRSFIAEGWVPTSRYDELETALHQAVGEHVECEELERVDYDEVSAGHGHGTQDDEPGDAGDVDRQPAAADGEGEPADVRPDGGHVDSSATSMHGDEPPVIQDNPDPVRPFETLVQAVNRPRYSELDPTIVLFLTFPAMFGLMIGDVGYGLLYLAMGYGLYRLFDSPGIRSLGGVAIWCGIFTTIFGVLYGEIFGFHTISAVLWEGTVGLAHAPIEKGLEPGSPYVLAWLVVSLLIGVVHLSTGFLFGFVNAYDEQGLVPAYLENGSWILMIVGLWTWVFSDHLGDPKPDFLFTVFSGEPLPLGFAGFPAAVGIAGVVAFFVGLVSMVYGEIRHEGALVGGISGVIESVNSFVHVVSYTRIAAVLVAKAGMAFVINLLISGVYQDEEGFHFLGLGTSSAPEGGELLFPGIVTLDGGLAVVVGSFLLGAVLFVVGHLVVLVLGITSAGLQGVRLEYVEFFGKFYDGGGENYEPFGYDRTHTTE